MKGDKWQEHGAKEENKWHLERKKVGENLSS